MHCQTTVFTKLRAGICGYVGMMGVMLLALGCHNVTPDEPPQTSRPARPMDVDPAVAANLGREALEKVGYDRDHGLGQPSRVCCVQRSHK